MNAVFIHDRLEDVADRRIPAHREDNVICGTQQSYIAALVERCSRYAILVKLTGNDTHTVVDAITQKSITLLDQLKQSLTWDRGMKWAQHKLCTVDPHVKVSSCDPTSPWQKGTHENTNKLLRQ